MARLRQVARPASQANWTEHFYSGELHVRGGECETDNENWINQLLGRGYVVVDETQQEDASDEEPSAVEVTVEETVVEEPQEEQPVEEPSEEPVEATPSEEEPTTDLVVEDASEDVPEVAEVEEAVEEPREADVGPSLEELMQQTLSEPKPKRSRRKKEQS